MAPRARNTESFGLEQSLWEAANRLRSNMDAAEYKHVVLGLVFLRYVSEVFTVRQEALSQLVRDPSSDYFMPTEAARNATLEDRDEYTSEGVFWIPEGHRWADLVRAGKQSNIGELIDAAMDAIERENPSLRGVLPKNFARRELAPQTLGGLLDTFSRSDLSAADRADTDVLGRVFEYMLAQFASAEGRLGGEFYTPSSVVRLMVEMLEPFQGRVYDPAMGSGGMFVQADKFVKAHGGVRNDIAVYGQEQNPTTWRLAKMNLALRGIDANLGPEWGDSFRNDLHPDLRADYILANPPFNISEWGGTELRDDRRWKFGVPPAGNANFAWLQHMVHHLAPGGSMASVLANGSLTSTQSAEAAIRRELVEADLVDCIVSLPTQLFYTTPIAVSIWFLSKNKGATARRRDRRGETLFIDASSCGHLTSRVHRELDEGDIETLSRVYHSWMGEEPGYVDVPGLCKSVPVEGIREQGYMLGPSRFVGFAEGDTTPISLAETELRSMALVQEGFAARLEIQQGVLDAVDGLASIGDSNRWPLTRIGDVAKVVGGGTPKTGVDEYFGGDVPWITPKDLTQHVGRYITHGARNLTASGLSASSARVIPKGSVLVSSRAPIGLVAIAGGDLSTNQGIRSLLLNDQQVPEFWYYLMRLSTRTLDAHANGTTFREISGSGLANIRLRIPDLAEQRRLADLLGSLDSEIENNLRINRALTEMITAHASNLFGA